MRRHHIRAAPRLSRACKVIDDWCLLGPEGTLEDASDLICMTITTASTTAILTRMHVAHANAHPLGGPSLKATKVQGIRRPIPLRMKTGGLNTCQV